jgi:predicted RNA binding protein YcfA (HicA-like mRNA interferase family)
MMAAPVRLAVVTHMLKQKGFFLHHVSGSHHVFKNAAGRPFIVPVHKNQVKFVYVKQIEKL